MEKDEDLLMEDAILYVQKQRYREGLSKNEKRTIRRKATRFTLRNGELLYTKKDKMKVRYITDPKEKKQILEDCHCDATSGHMGTKRTLARITERFIWAGVAKDAYSLVHRCDACQRMTKKIKTGTPELHPVPVVSTWYHLGIDFVGPLAYKSNQGNTYILTVSDYFSKFVQAIPCKNKEASTVCEALFQLFMQFGIPKAITTDQGTEFNNALDKKMMKQLNINHRLTTPYHPQANGLVERFNQTIQNMFVKYVQEKKQAWEDYISTCVYAYNTSKHESSKFCPFTVMFGRSAVLPIDLKLSSDVATSLKADQNTDELIEENQTYREKMMEKVKANIVAAQSRQKEQYDKKHHDSEIFAEGALVLKRDMTRKKRAGGKMDSKWIGPYRIMKSMGKGLYQIESADTPNVKIQRVHGMHLKPYYPSAKTVSMASSLRQADIADIPNKSSIESSFSDYEVSFEVSMTTNSSNQDHYCNGDNKFSSEHSPVMHSEAAESKVIKCEDTVTESEAPQSKCTEPKAAQYATVDFAAAEFNNTSFKDSNGAEYKDIRSNNAESRGFESNTADCLSIGSIPTESKATCSMGGNSMAAEFKETNLCDMLNRCMLCGRSDNSISLDAYRDWVQCGQCMKWVHIICTGMKREALEDSIEYKCPECDNMHNNFV